MQKILDDMITFLQLEDYNATVAFGLFAIVFLLLFRR